LTTNGQEPATGIVSGDAGRPPGPGEATLTTTLVILVAVALVFDFWNGYNDSASIVSTMISSRALSPRAALRLTAVCEFLGPFLFGVAVATTIGAGVLRLPPGAESLPLIVAALVAAVGWNILTSRLGIPSSSSHALVGGLIGSAFMDGLVRHHHGMITMADMHHALDVIQVAGFLKIVLALLLAPLAGFVAGYLLMRLVLFLARNSTPGVNWIFKRGQILTAICLALAHGANDAQKTMGIITMGLVALGMLPEFKVPLWVVGGAAFSIAAGTVTGGWRLIKTIGGKFYKIRPVHGFTTQIGSAGVILGAALVGGPVSTSHVVSSAIMGAGSAERFSKVRWGVGKRIVLTWVITIPATCIASALVFCGVRKLM
jgi:PiT family inorganic phosphate transporter